MEIKDKHAKETSFSRALIAGLICGLITAVLVAAYNFYYRKTTGFVEGKFIEPLLIFIAFPLLLIIVGFLFFEMVEVMKRGRLVFTIFFLALMLVAIILNLSSGGMSGIKGLLLGIEGITGLIISFLLPFLATHPKLFMEEEELAESGQ